MRGGGVYFGGGNPSIVLNFFICINSVRTPRPCGLKLSLTLSFLVRAKGGGVLGVWVGAVGEGVVDHGKDTIRVPCIALVPPHFTPRLSGLQMYPRPSPTCKG